MFGISIVVVSYNSMSIIEPTMNALFTQKNTAYIPWEVIFVNNNSTDGTVSIVEKLALDHQVVNLRIVTETRPGTAFARFKGIEESQYEIICFVDDDNRVTDTWVETAFELMKEKDIGILGCGGVGEFEEEPPAWFESEKEAYAIGSLYPNEKLLDMTFDGNLPTAGMCIRKEVFTNLKKQNWQAQLTGRVGDSQAPGEDSELCQAARLLGYKTFYTDELSFTHFMPKNRISWERFLAMTYGFGVTDVFLLPYKLEYDKRKYGVKLKYHLRKIWHINYVGKKISLVISYFKLLAGEISNSNFEKIKARNSGFCETIWKEKAKFTKAFLDVEKLKPIN